MWLFFYPIFTLPEVAASMVFVGSFCTNPPNVYFFDTGLIPGLILGGTSAPVNIHPVLLPFGMVFIRVFAVILESLRDGLILMKVIRLL